ncbi:unnamed protein product [Prunus brigantina]
MRHYGLLAVRQGWLFSRFEVDRVVGCTFVGFFCDEIWDLGGGRTLTIFGKFVCINEFADKV